MKLYFEYGPGVLPADLPDSTDVFIPGQTVPDPPSLADVQSATRESIRNPIGMLPISRLAFKGARAAVVFPDRVKGGEQQDAHRKVAIPILLDELNSAGVRKKDIVLICSNGLHRKNTEPEIRRLLGDQVFDEFWSSGQIIQHDSEDEAHLVDLGTTARGDPVWMNRYVYEADLPILVGHVLGNPYGGYSGGYKHCATGIIHWRSIASHHAPQVMHRADFIPVSHSSLMRAKFDEIGQHMERRMGKPFFCCDAVLDSRLRQIEIFSGWAKEMQPRSWETADRRTYVPWAEKKYDVLIFGLPQSFHYGDGMGTNPIMLLQAISAQVIRHRRVLSDRCVVICASLCNGFFNDEIWPYLREMYDLLQRGRLTRQADFDELAESIALNKEYVRKYRDEYAYHPFHGFSMVSCGQIAQMHASAIYIVGAQKPEYAHGMGLIPRATVEEALADARGNYVGDAPNILALPLAFKTTAVHLCMKQPG